MNSELEPYLENLGLGVARIAISPTDPSVLDVAYYGGSERAETAVRSLRSEKPIQFPGVMNVPDLGLEISLAQSSSYSFAISVNQDGISVARGMGLIDRDHPEAVLVAWWTMETEPYGVVKYSIRDDRTVIGYYISKMTTDDPGEDVAIGDTSRGFSGDFVLNSREVSGRTWGPHDWKLSSRGEVTDLTWSENGRVFCRGVGMIDPQDRRSIIATYIPV